MEGSALLADAVIGDNFWRSLTLDCQAPPRDGATPVIMPAPFQVFVQHPSLFLQALNHNSLPEPKISPAFHITFPKEQSRKEKAFLLASKMANLYKSHSSVTILSINLFSPFRG